MLEAKDKPNLLAGGNPVLSPTFSQSFSDLNDDEFTLRRKPCTLGESGFLRAPNWVLRCFMWLYRLGIPLEAQWTVL